MISAMDDDRLLQEIGQLLRPAEAVPPKLTVAARSTLAWQRMDGGPAELPGGRAIETGWVAI